MAQLLTLKELCNLKNGEGYYYFHPYHGENFKVVLGFDEAPHLDVGIVSLSTLLNYVKMSHDSQYHGPFLVQYPKHTRQYVEAGLYKL